MKESLAGQESISSFKPKEDPGINYLLTTGMECLIPAFGAIFILRIIQYRIELKIENWQKRKMLEALKKEAGIAE